MNLTEQPEYIHWPETYYVFVEKVGPFMQNAPAAWEDAHRLTPALAEHNRIIGYMSLYKMATSTYRAGFALEAPPSELPKGLSYERFAGGRYAKFLLTGPYMQLVPCPSGFVLSQVPKAGPGAPRLIPFITKSSRHGTRAGHGACDGDGERAGNCGSRWMVHRELSERSAEHAGGGAEDGDLRAGVKSTDQKAGNEGTKGRTMGSSSQPSATRAEAEG